MSRVEDCKKHGISLSTLKVRMRKGMTYKEALNAPKRSWVVNDGEREYSSLRAAAKENGVNYDSLRDNMDKGLSLKEAIKMTKENARGPYGSCVDPYGNVFPSKQAMCKAYGINRTTFDDRIERGMSEREALEADAYSVFIGPDGERYPTRQALYDACNISASVYRNYLNKGVDEADARKKASRPVYIGPDGEEYSSARDMCRVKGVKYATFKKRREKGASVEEALMIVPPKKKWTAPDGRVFDTLEALAGVYNENLATLKERLKRMDMYHALNDPKKRGAKKVVDHNGIVYESEKAMCDAHGVNYSTYLNRRKRGKSVEESLRVDEKPLVIDHKGNVYKSIAEMCRAYGINPRRYEQRMRMGWDQERALTEPVKRDGLKNFHGFKGIFVMEIEGVAYYAVECTKCGLMDVLTKEEMEAHECTGKGVT